MNDEQLKTMTESELRARFNAAPEYLQSLLARKRALAQDTIWEVNLCQRAAPRPGERKP